MSRLSKRAILMAVATMLAGFDSAVTIAAPTPGFLSQGFNATAESPRGARRMIEEKIDAACERAAAQSAWASILLKASFGSIRDADDFSLAWPASLKRPSGPPDAKSAPTPSGLRRRRRSVRAFPPQSFRASRDR